MTPREYAKAMLVAYGMDLPESRAATELLVETLWAELRRLRQVPPGPDHQIARTTAYATLRRLLTSPAGLTIGTAQRWALSGAVCGAK